MDFFENVKSAVGNAAQTVVKKSGEVVEYSKIKYSMFDTSNGIKNLYAQIGEAIYKSYKNDTPIDDSVKEKCAEIDKLSEQLEVYAEQLSGINSSVKCSACGKNVKDECTYCPYCGDKLAKDVEADFDGADNEYYSPSAGDVGDEAQDSAEPTDDIKPESDDSAGE